MPFKLHPKLESDSIVIGNFKLSRLLLINDQQYPWFVLVPQRTDISEIYQLREKDQHLLWLESRQLSMAMMALFKGYKLNVAAIGNLVPQLHLHHVVRFREDICWPAPVWGKFPAKPYSSPQLQIVVGDIGQSLTNTSFVAS